MKKRVKMDEIKISKRFLRFNPSEKKMNECRTYYKKHGTIDKNIIVNKNMRLKDGYVRYLVLKENGVTEVEVDEMGGCDNLCNDKDIVYVFGKHPGIEKEFVWRMAKSTINPENLGIGKTVIVQTKYGIRRVIVTRIETLSNPPVQERVKKVRRCCLK